MSPQRLLYLDEISTAEEVASAAKAISAFTKWPIEFMTFDRTIKKDDVIWESW